MHTLRLVAVAVQDAGFPAQASAQLVGPPRSPAVFSFTLASVGQTVALATGEHPTTMQDGHPSAAADRRAPPPDPPAAEAAVCPVEPHHVVHRLPLAAVVVVAAVAVVHGLILALANRAAPPPRAYCCRGLRSYSQRQLSVQSIAASGDGLRPTAAARRSSRKAAARRAHEAQ